MRARKEIRSELERWNQSVKEIYMLRFKMYKGWYKLYLYEAYQRALTIMTAILKFHRSCIAAQPHIKTNVSLQNRTEIVSALAILVQITRILYVCDHTGDVVKNVPYISVNCLRRIEKNLVWKIWNFFQFFSSSL